MARSPEEQLRYFLVHVEKMLASRAVTEGAVRAKWTIEGNEGEEIKVTADFGDHDLVRSLLIDVRQVLSDKEDVFFYRIAHIMELALVDDELRQLNRRNRRAWKTSQQHGALSASINGLKLDPGTTFDVLVKATMFHSDNEDHHQLVESLDEATSTMLWWVVYRLTNDCLHICSAQHSLILEAFDRDAFDFSLIDERPR